jgi:uncharacterized DUF497 family protein
VEFEWDSRKAASNLRKHGIPFPFAARVFLDDNRMERLDRDGNYEEDRWITLGVVDDLEIVVVYTTRAKVFRIISARRANRHEREEYWNR